MKSDYFVDCFAIRIPDAPDIQKIIEKNRDEYYSPDIDDRGNPAFFLPGMLIVSPNRRIAASEQLSVNLPRFDQVKNRNEKPEDAFLRTEPLTHTFER